MSICWGTIAGAGLGAGAAAAPDTCACGCCVGVGSGSRIRAPKPRPSAFLLIGDNLLGELDIAFSSFTMYVVEDDRFSVARGLCEPYISGNDRAKHLSAEEAT